ncbi:putative CRAL-TRIO lipid binding domain, CRAL/TRIO domain-containing protein [Lupinus albus]|uniref:Putative CRAL-TRIO lipid binding domain, CRAL/TRIO domain-containing protein n=1 Tax=Lupinus albus TaxID=3870 RepID=A0A6A4Q9B6_LUPAL|nr:putative CRAL-TRIO lipid binding domain, CRAL/TRIO domain-containing protein [Lupinus albus]
MANDGTKEGGAIEQVVVDDHGVEKDSTENEITKIHLIRHFVESRDPSSKKEDDLMLRRFLRARDLDIEKASTMFLKYLKWRHSFVPNGSISLQEILNDLAHDKVFVQGHDKSGRPIAIILGARHFQNKNGLEEFKRMFSPSTFTYTMTMLHTTTIYFSFLSLKIVHFIYILVPRKLYF